MRRRLLRILLNAATVLSLVLCVATVAAAGTRAWRREDGDFTHSPEQWRFKAWMRPKVLEDRLRFNILTPKDSTLSKTVYGVYHGRLIEMLLRHFDSKFSRANATALAVEGDRVTG